MNSGEQSEAQRGALATSMATTPAYLMNSRENAYEVLKKDYISTLLSGDEIRKSVADSNLKDAVLHFENFEHYRDPQSGHYWDPLLGTYHPNFEVNVLQVVDDLKRSAIRDHINVVANDPAIEPSAKLATWAKLLPLLERFDRAPQLFLRDVVREACMNIKAGLDIHSEFYSSQDVTTLSSLAKISGVSLGIVDNVDRNNVFNSVYKIAHRIITSQNLLNIGEAEFSHAGYLIAQTCTGEALAKIAANGLRPLLKLAAEFDRYPADHIYDSASKRVMHQLIVKTRIDQLQDDADISAFAKYYVDHFDSFHSDGSPIWILPPSMRTQRCLEIASKLISSSTTDKNAERAVALSATSFLGNVRLAGANAINLSQAAALAEIYSQRLQDPDCRAALQEIGDRLLRHPLEPVTGATVDIVLSLGRSFHQLPIDVAFRQPVLNYIASQTLSLDLSNLDEERASLANTHYSSIIEPYINAPNISVADKENAQSNYGATMGEMAPSVSMQTSPHEIVFGGQQLSPPEPSSPLPSEPSLPLETDSSIDARPRLNEIVFGNLQLSPSEQESLLRWNPSVRMPSMPSRIDATYSPQEPFEPIFSPAAPSSVNSPAEQSELGVEEPPQNISESEPPLVTTPKISMPMPPSPRGFVTLDPYDRDFPSLPPPTVDAPNRSTALVAAQPPQRIFRPTPLPRTTPPVTDVNPLQLSEVGRPDQYPSISMPQTPSGIAPTDSPQRPFDSEQSEFGAEDSQQRHYESAFPSLGTSSPSTPAKSSGSINDNLRQRRFRPTPRQGSMQKPTELVQTLSKPSIVGAPESSESATTTSDTPAMPHRKAVAPPEASHPPILGRMRKQPKQVERKPQKEKQPTQKREELEPAKPVAVEEAPTTNKVEQRLAVEPWRDFETRPIPETALESAIVASAKSCFDADKFLQDFQNFGEAEGAAALAFGVRALDRKLLIGNDAAADLLGDSSASSLIVDQKSIHDRFIQADRVLRTQPKSVAQLNQFMVFIKENGIQAPGVEFSQVMKEGLLETGIDDQASIAWAYEASKYFAAYPDETLPDNAVTAANAILANPDKLGRLKRNQLIRETLDKFDANVSRAITSEANLDVDKLIDVLDQYRQGDRDKRFELSQKIHQITEGTNKEEIIEKILSDSRRNSEAPTNTPPSVEAISDYFSQVLRQPLSASHPDGYLSAIQIYANDPEIAANFSDLEWWSTFVDGPSNDRRAIFLLRDTFVALKKDPNASLPRTMDELKEAALQNAGKYAEEYRQRLISQAENRRQDKERRLLKAVFVEASSNTESFQKFMAAFIPVVRENDVPDPNYVKNTQDAFALQPSVSEAALVTAVAENNEWLAICKASANWERELNADEDALRTDAGDRGAGHLETVRNSIATSMEPAAQQAVMNQLWEQRVSRAIPIVEHPSLRVVHEFFSHYPDDLSTHFPSASKADWKDLQNYVLAQREKREQILAWSQAKEKLKYLKNSLNIPADLDSSLRNADEKEGNIVRAVLNCMKEKAGDFVAAGLVLIDRQKEMSDTEVARLMAEHPAGQLLVIPTHPIMEREYESWRKCLETPLSKPWRKRYLSGVNSCLDKTEDVASVLWSDRELKHAPQPDRAAVELLANFFRAFPEFRGEIASGKNIEDTLTFVSKNLDQYIRRDKKAYENNVRRSEAKTVLDLIEKMRLRPLASQFDALQGMTETLHGSESASQKAPESDDHEERTQAKKFFAMCRKALSSDDTALRIAAMQQNPSVNRNDLASWMVEDKASYVWMCDQLRQSDVKIAAVFEYQHKTMEMLQSPIAETYHSEFLEEIATLCGNTAHRQSLDAKKAEKSIMARFAGRFPNDSEKASLDCMVEMARCLMRDKTLPYPKTADDIEQSRRTMLSMQRTQVIDYFVGTARKHLGKVDTAEAAVNARLDGFSAALNAVKSLSDDNNDVLKMIEAHRARLINSPNKSADYMGRLLTAVTGLFETEVRKTKSESVRDCLVSVGVECIRNFKEPLPKLLKDAQAKEMTRLLKEIEADKSVLPTMAQSERPVPNERAAEVVKTSGSKPATESHQAQHDRLFATLNETQKDVVTKGKFLLAEFGCPATFAAICRHKTLDQNGQLETALIEHRGKTISIEGEARRVMYVTPVHSIKPDDLPTLASLPTTNEEGNNAVTLHLIKPRVLEDTPARTVKLGR